MGTDQKVGHHAGSMTAAPPVLAPQDAGDIRTFLIERIETQTSKSTSLDSLVGVRA